MLCDVCKKREAVVHITTFENGQRTEMHLCAACANAKRKYSEFRGFNIVDNDFFRKMAYPDYADQSKEEPRCASCGMTYSEFNRLGSLAVQTAMRLLKRKYRHCCAVYTATASMSAKYPTAGPAYSAR